MEYGIIYEKNKRKICAPMLMLINDIGDRRSYARGVITLAKGLISW